MLHYPGPWLGATTVAAEQYVVCEWSKDFYLLGKFPLKASKHMRICCFTAINK